MYPVIGPFKELYTSLHTLADLFILARHQLGFSGKHSSHAAITHEGYSPTFPPPSVARYSLIQLSELGRREENENA